MVVASRAACRATLLTAKIRSTLRATRSAAIGESNAGSLFVICGISVTFAGSLKPPERRPAKNAVIRVGAATFGPGQKKADDWNLFGLLRARR